MLGILVWQEGGEAVAALIVVGALALARWRWLAGAPQAEGKPTLLDPGLFRSTLFRLGITGQMLQQIALGGTMIALPIYLQMVLEYNAMEAGLSIAPLSLSMFAVALLAGKKAGTRRPSSIIRARVRARAARDGDLIPIVPHADSGWDLVVPLLIAGCGAGPAGLPAQQLHAVADLGGACQRGRRRELGRRLVRVVVRPGFRRRHHAGHALLHVHQHGAGQRRAPAGQQQTVADALEEDAEVMSNTQLEAQLAGQPEAIQDEIIRINTDARPIALQVAMLVPAVAGLLGLLLSFRMMRVPDPAPSASTEGMAFG